MAEKQTKAKVGQMPKDKSAAQVRREKSVLKIAPDAKGAELDMPMNPGKPAFQRSPVTAPLTHEDIED